MKKILLLGPDGQLGSDIRHLASTAPFNSAFSVKPLGRNSLDLLAEEKIQPALEQEDFDCVVYSASIHKTDSIEDDATPAFHVNAYAANAIASYCNTVGARFIYISTDYVFSGIGRNSPYQEEDATGPVNVYGASKAMGERLVLQYPIATVLRVASLFGIAGASGKGGNFVETMIRLGREKGKLSVVADQFMSPTSTADIADMIIKLLFKNAEAGIYHAVNSGSASWFEFADTIIKRANIDAEVAPTTSDAFKTRALRPQYSVLENSKISEVIGTPPHWSDALDRYLAAKGHI